MFTTWLNMGLLWQAWVKKTVCEVETQYLFSKEKKVLGAVVGKESEADSFLGHERTYHCWFSW